MVLSRCFEVFIREKILDGCQSSSRGFTAMMLPIFSLFKTERYYVGS